MPLIYKVSYLNIDLQPSNQKIMKRLANLLLVGLFLPLLTACPSAWEPEPPQVSSYQPVLMTRQQLEASVIMKPAQAITNPGKLYKYGNYILINERYKGVHIIDNQDPTSPQNIGFIQVPGNIDFAVKNNVLYVDNAVDMVALNISDPNNLQISKRIRSVFSEPVTPDGLTPQYDRAGIPQDAIVVGWKLKVK